MEAQRIIEKIKEAEETAQGLRNEGWNDRETYEVSLVKLNERIESMERAIKFLRLNEKINLIHFIRPGIKKDSIEQINNSLDYYLGDLGENHVKARVFEKKYGVNPEISERETAEDYLQDGLRLHRRLCYLFAGQLPWGEKPEEILK